MATWEDSPWSDEHLPRPALVEGKLGQWHFIKGTTRTARSLWPMSLAAGRRLDGWTSDGSDADEGSHVETLGTIDLPYGDLEEASAKRSRGEPASATTRPEQVPTANGSGPPSSKLVMSLTKQTSKKARVSRGAGPIDVTSKIANLAALAKRAAKSTPKG